MSVTFPGETAEYRAAREQLLEREIELRRAMEDVAVARRALPMGGAVPEDYVFVGAGPDGAPTEIRMSELFAAGKDSLVVYSYMFPRHPGDDRPGPEGGESARLALEETPCPSCTALIDQLEGAAEHVEQHVNLAIVARAPFAHLETFGRERGWRRLHLLSAGANTYTHDYHGQSEDGSSLPILNVFHRDGDTIRHFWGSELGSVPPEPGQDPRAVGTIETLWNLLDFTPEGRPNWDEQLSYDCCKSAT